ncbi:hypothetical protein A2955_05200 [Candidatus Woesebacteria bacterium RIFCSPLOWO2_01_FULL_37_19]|uniref:RNA polymerase sigma-70 region 2 domain-containing protein n=2 Tax=Candidatus Woeseibacteriota TaxID=1752722 RepID=A0A1F8AYZ3_9BACT|nr:MAG: hypothetical protein A2771_01330 [Candidatus Woesebacteria bacterium RIFCSPHIGHO2_01_FULL_38_26b]OGM56983.1 MAG: hypothetical protein A2955_05200 [Candidatus Woesebacteria bacterium RIFCSPLOWO2_01_FULL_37_19]
MKEKPSRIELLSHPEENSSKIIILADLSDGEGDLVPIKVDKGIFERVKRVLESKNLTANKIGAGIFIFGVGVGVAYTAEKAWENIRKNSFKGLNEEQKDRFEKIMEENSGDIYSYLYFGLNGSEAETEDLTQKVFERAYINFPNFKPKSELENPERSWLFRIAHNSLINHRRDEIHRKSKLVELITDEESEDGEEIFPDPLRNKIHQIEDEISFTSAQVGALRQILENLSDKRKLLIYLKIGEHLRDKETAYIMNMTEGAVKTLYSRTKRELKNSMNEIGLKV